jgi:hypothetical protein
VDGVGLVGGLGSGTSLSDDSGWGRTGSAAPRGEKLLFQHHFLALGALSARVSVAGGEKLLFQHHFLAP